jgi:hypothetical protein
MPSYDRFFLDLATMLFQMKVQRRDPIFLRKDIAVELEGSFWVVERKFSNKITVPGSLWAVFFNFNYPDRHDWRRLTGKTGSCTDRRLCLTWFAEHCAGLPDGIVSNQKSQFG